MQTRDSFPVSRMISLPLAPIVFRRPSSRHQSGLWRFFNPSTIVDPRRESRFLPSSTIFKPFSREGAVATDGLPRGHGLQGPTLGPAPSEREGQHQKNFRGGQPVWESRCAVLKSRPNVILSIQPSSFKSVSRIVVLSSVPSPIRGPLEKGTPVQDAPKGRDQKTSRPFPSTRPADIGRFRQLSESQSVFVP